MHPPFSGMKKLLLLLALSAAASGRGLPSAGPNYGGMQQASNQILEDEGFLNSQNPGGFYTEFGQQSTGPNPYVMLPVEDEQFQASVNPETFQPVAGQEYLGPSYVGTQQPLYQIAQDEQQSKTNIFDYTAQSIDESQDEVGYMSVPGEQDDIPLAAIGHDIHEHNRLLHEPMKTSHDFTGMNPWEQDDDEEAVAQQHDALVDQSIHSLAGVNVEHDEIIHQHVHPDELTRHLATALQNDQRGFEHKVDQLTWKINGEKEAKHYGESQFELASAKPGDANHVAEGMPYEVLLKGGSYYDTMSRNSYITSSMALILGALIGIIFLLLGCLLAIIYVKTGWSITDALCESELDRADKIAEIEAMVPEMVPCCECPEDRQIRPKGWRHKKKKKGGSSRRRRPQAGDSEAEAMTADDITPGSEY